MSFEKPTALERSVLRALREARAWSPADLSAESGIATALSASNSSGLSGNLESRAPKHVISGAFLSAAMRSLGADTGSGGGEINSKSGSEVAREIRHPKRNDSGHYLDQPSFELPPGFVIEGDLDLKYADVPISVAFSGCEFRGGIYLDGARLRSWEFFDKLSQAEIFSAIGARFDGNLVLNKLEGKQDLARWRKIDELTLRLKDIQKESGLEINLPERRPLTVDLHRVSTRGYLAMNEIFVDGELDLEAAEIGGSFFLDDAFIALGVVDLNSANIGSQFSANEACLIAKKADQDALNMSGARVAGGVFLGVGCTCVGGVSFVGATASNIIGDGGRFLNANRVALDFDALSARQVFLRNVMAEGRVDFSAARITGSVDCRSSKFWKGEVPQEDEVKEKSVTRLFKPGRKGAPLRKTLTMAAAEVGGDLRISDIEKLEGLVDLRQAKARILIDDDRYWRKKSVRFLLDGFTYDRLGDDPFGGNARAIVNADTRMRWLKSQPATEISGNSFKPQPFSQLAATLTDMGHVAEAKRILFHRDKQIATNQNRRLPSDWYLIVPVVGWMFTVFFNFLVGLTLGFGHRPQRAAVTVLACLGLGWAVFGAADRAGMISSTATSPPTDDFSPLIYSADVFLPIIDLGEEKAWMVSRPLTADLSAEMVGPVRAIALGPNLGSTEANPANMITIDRVEAVRLFLIVFGWFFSTLIAAGVTGLLAKTR